MLLFLLLITDHGFIVHYMELYSGCTQQRCLVAAL